MNECPICHVMNDAQAYFCTECGQRFSPATQNLGQAPQTPQAPAGQQWQGGPAPTEPNFNSPSPDQQFSHTIPEAAPSSPFPTGGQPLFQPTPPPVTDPGFGMGPAVGADIPTEATQPVKRPRLHSPMLGGSDMEPEPERPMQQNSRGGLRSPLLRGEDDPDARRSRGGRQPVQPDYDDNEPPAQSNTKGKGLRSPLLGGGDEDEDSAPRQRSSGRVAKSGPLRSPLLSGGDEDDFGAPKGGDRTAFPHRRRKDDSGEDHSDQDTQGRSTGRPLRSPLLGGSDAEDDPDGPRRRTTDSSAPRVPTGGHRRLHSPVLDGTGEFNYDDFADEADEYDENDPNILRSPLLAAKQRRTEKPAVIEPPRPNTEASMPEPSFNQVDYKRQQAGIVPPPSVPGDTPLMLEAQQAPPPVVTTAPATPQPKVRAVTPLGANEEHSRVPLSIYDSGLRDTIPGAVQQQSGPAIALLVPSVLALVCKLMYFGDLAKVPNIGQQTWFILDQVGQALVLVGLIIFAISRKR